MSYTRPTYNSDNITWSGASSYTRPPYNNDQISFEQSSVVEGIIELTVTTTVEQSISSNLLGSLSFNTTIDYLLQKEITTSSDLELSISSEILSQGGKSISLSSDFNTLYSESSIPLYIRVSEANYTVSGGLLSNNIKRSNTFSLIDSSFNSLPQNTSSSFRDTSLTSLHSVINEQNKISYPSLNLGIIGGMSYNNTAEKNSEALLIYTFSKEASVTKDTSLLSEIVLIEGLSTGLIRNSYEIVELPLSINILSTNNKYSNIGTVIELDSSITATSYKESSNSISLPFSSLIGINRNSIALGTSLFFSTYNISPINTKNTEAASSIDSLNTLVSFGINPESFSNMSGKAAVLVSIIELKALLSCLEQDILLEEMPRVMIISDNNRDVLFEENSQGVLLPYINRNIFLITKDK